MTEMTIDGRDVDEVAAWALVPGGPDVLTQGDRRWLSGVDLATAVDGGWRRVARDVGSGEWLVWRPLPAVRPAADPVVVTDPCGGRPDVQRLWLVVQRLAQAQVGALLGEVRWRMGADDWEAIRADARLASASSAELRPPPSPGEPWLLFGVPVDVVDPVEGGWPQLVLVVDRRV